MASRQYSLVGNKIFGHISKKSSRGIFTSAINSKDGSSDGFFSKLFVRRIEPTHESHSTMLADKEVIYEMQTHQVKPAFCQKYLDNYERHVQLATTLKSGELVGSWSVGVGDQDQVIHLWRYTGGYSGMDEALKTINHNADYQKLLKERLECLRLRQSQYMLPFSYWPLAKPGTNNNVYEIRSYILKPGTMIEWGNNWARAIAFRQHNEEAFGGFFSQIGRLYNVHHFWRYKDLQTRKETREAAWRKPGWDECVAYTVPLIREMDSRILLPNKFSPTK